MGLGRLCLADEHFAERHALVVIYDEMGAAVTATFGAADTMLFGRKTYDS